MSNAAVSPQMEAHGQSGAEGDLPALVYDELRRLAVQKMARESPAHTLQPTALVHEAWLRMGGQGVTQFTEQASYYAAAAEAMRRILIDRARRRKAVRHGGGQQRLDLEEAEIATPASDEQMLAVHEALEKLAAEDPRKAELVKLRYFVGMTLGEAAGALGVSEPTAKRYWAYARAWLFSEIKRQRSGA